MEMYTLMHQEVIKEFTTISRNVKHFSHTDDAALNL